MKDTCFDIIHVIENSKQQRQSVMDYSIYCIFVMKYDANTEL